jgi:enoyl-CoA hydratase
VSDLQTSAVTVTQAGGVATLTLSRPEALNAINAKMLQQLDVALAAAAVDHGLRIVIITGQGRAFSAGVDLNAIGRSGQAGGDIGSSMNSLARSVIDRIATMPQVVIAKVNGFCMTGALELAMACDLIVAADEATFADTHAKWGLRPTWGMSQRLPRLVGVARARELSFTGRRFSGIDAAAWGLAVRSVPLEELDAAVEELVADVVANSGGSIAAYKDLYRTALDKPLGEGLRYEADTSYDIADSEERIASFTKR